MSPRSSFFTAVLLLSNISGISSAAVSLHSDCPTAYSCEAGANFCPEIDCGGSIADHINHRIDSCEAVADGSCGNGKKVYADHHGVRYTREHDGKLGRWEMYADTEKSSTGRKSLCYNADLVDEQGRHDIAAVNYPLVGMQSNLDEDYIEYQILSAKTAKIDGFFIEWGFFPHENDVLLRAMQKVAAKYDFEIGVNWCDGWLYYNWITKIYPEIDTREKKTEYMAKCYRYLADSVYSVSTAAKVKGMPVFYHFGPGATVEEYKTVLSSSSHLRDSASSAPYYTEKLVGLRRWADWGHLENDRYIPVTQSDELDAWIEEGEIPTPWIPARVRERDAEHPYWDNYAVEDDLIEFMKPFRDSVWMNPRSSYVVKSGFAMPGMDNRGCAGWGRGHFFLIPRNEGHTYDAMWRFCMENKDSLDMMFIASWSDYTEGHEIEPTVENGYREIKTTLRYASEFKNEKCDSSGLALPLTLFKLRKKAEFISSVLNCNFLSLDKAAEAISHGEYDNATVLMEKTEKQLNKLYKKIESRQIHISFGEQLNNSPATICKYCANQSEGICKNCVNYSMTIHNDGKNGTKSLYIDEEIVREIERAARYTGTISFEYKDDGHEFLFVRSETDREPAGTFGVVGKLRTDGSGEWKKAVINLYDHNIAYREGKPAFRISGNVETRNVEIELNLFSSRDNSYPQGSCL